MQFFMRISQAGIYKRGLANGQVGVGVVVGYVKVSRERVEVALK